MERFAPSARAGSGSPSGSDDDDGAARRAVALRRAASRDSAAREAEVAALERDVAAELRGDGAQLSKYELQRVKLISKFAERTDEFRRYEEKLDRRARDAERSAKRALKEAAALQQAHAALHDELEASREFIGALQKSQRTRLNGALGDGSPATRFVSPEQPPAGIGFVAKHAHAELHELRHHAAALADELDRVRGERGRSDATPAKAPRSPLELGTTDAMTRLEFALERERARTAAAKAEAGKARRDCRHRGALVSARRLVAALRRCAVARRFRGWRARALAQSHLFKVLGRLGAMAKRRAVAAWRRATAASRALGAAASDVEVTLDRLLAASPTAKKNGTCKSTVAGSRENDGQAEVRSAATGESDDESSDCDSVSSGMDAVFSACAVPPLLRSQLERLAFGMRKAQQRAAALEAKRSTLRTALEEQRAQLEKAHAAQCADGAALRAREGADREALESAARADSWRVDCAAAQAEAKEARAMAARLSRELGVRKGEVAALHEERQAYILENERMRAALEGYEHGEYGDGGDGGDGVSDDDDEPRSPSMQYGLASSDSARRLAETLARLTRGHPAGDADPPPRDSEDPRAAARGASSEERAPQSAVRARTDHTTDGQSRPERRHETGSSAASPEASDGSYEFIPRASTEVESLRSALATARAALAAQCEVATSSDRALESRLEAASSQLVAAEARVLGVTAAADAKCAALFKASEAAGAAADARQRQSADAANAANCACDAMRSAARLRDDAAAAASSTSTFAQISTDDARRRLGDEAGDAARAAAAAEHRASALRRDLDAAAAAGVFTQAALAEADARADTRAASFDAAIEAERALALASVERSKRANLRCIRLAVRCSRGEAQVEALMASLAATRTRAARAAGAALAAVDEREADDAARVARDRDAERRVSAARADAGALKQAHSAALARLQAADARQNAALDSARSEHDDRLRTSVSAAWARGRDEARAAAEAFVQEAQEALASKAEASSRRGDCDRFRVLEDALRRSETSRRSLHNTLQELRGNIRVVARLRGDGRRAKGGVTVLASKNAVVVKSPERAGVDGTPRAATKAAFTFDRAFGPAATQADVFEEVAELCQSAMDGYDVCILAYGATGSGKTFTMHGGAARGGPADASDGIVPRACAALAEAQRQLSAAGWNYDVAASCVEVYEERLYDLLADEPVHLAQTQRPGAWGDDDDDARGTYPLLEHATWVQIAADDRSAIEALQARARLARHTSATLLNNRSSRSHAVFTLRLRGEHAGRGETRLGSLVLVDLAGSERVSRSGALADDRQLREACAINKSLSCLVDVFTALGPPAKGATKPKHVPYRNSKLTLLLRRALSGDGKTLLIATLSPDDEELQQTTSTLRFAQHLSSIECGKPTKHATTAPAKMRRASSASARG